MTYLDCVAIDPGKHMCGVAIFEANQLVDATLIQPQPEDPYYVAQHAALWVSTRIGGKVDLLAVEGQQIYARGGGNPNDLLPLAQVVGAVQARIPHRDRMIVMPRTWTKGVPKVPRVRKVLAALSDHERKIIEDLTCRKALVHNVVDAVGIGLYVLNRFHATTEEVQ